MAKARKRSVEEPTSKDSSLTPASKAAKKTATGEPMGRKDRFSVDVGQLGTAPFFTLTQLVRAWTDQHADSEKLANRRRTVRDNTINKGCPHVVLGVETVFVTESFVEWLKEKEWRSGPTNQ